MAIVFKNSRDVLADNEHLIAIITEEEANEKGIVDLKQGLKVNKWSTEEITAHT